MGPKPTTRPWIHSPVRRVARAAAGISSMAAHRMQDIRRDKKADPANAAVGKVAKVQVRRDHRAPDQAEGQFPYKAGTQPSRAAPPTAGNVPLGKMFRITSSKIQPINSASRYHMGPQEKELLPEVGGRCGADPAESRLPP